MISEPGRYKISEQEYHADPCPSPSLSSGMIRVLVSDCPARAYHTHPKLGGDQEDVSSSSQEMGTVCHGMLLEGIDKAVPIDPKNYAGKKGGIPIGWTNDAIREARDEVRLSGKIPLLLNDHNKACQIVEAARERLASSELRLTDLPSQGDSELSYIWQEENGIYCRSRKDWISKDRKIILDCKFTGKPAHPEAFDRSVTAYGYDIQSAWYRRGAKAVDGEDPVFIFAVFETNPPYLGSLIGLDPAYDELGRQKVEEGIRLWSECLLLGEWKGYPNRVCYLSPKPYVIAGWNERQITTQLAEQENQEDGYPF